MMWTRLLLGVLLHASLIGCSTLDTLIAQAGGLGASPPREAAAPRPEPVAGERSPRAAPPPIFCDWWYMYPESMTRTAKPKQGDPCATVERFRYDSPEMYVPVNCPGAAHGGPSYVAAGWYAWYARCFAQELDRAGAPIAILIRERNCPYPYATGGKPTSPGEVAAALDALPKLDYLFMDLEPIGGGTTDDVARNVEEIHRLVRAHPNPRIRDAYLGNYDDWPGATDDARIWPDQRDRVQSAPMGGRSQDEFYHANLNVAMPSIYPYQVYSEHADRRTQKGEVAPSGRAAAFWAPIERLSEAARNLPEGNLLIPWVSDYVATKKANDRYDAPPPPREDLSALIEHARLRGAYSYFLWTSDQRQTDHPGVDYQTYRDLAIRAWRSLDPLFDAGGSPRVLNLTTDKASGVEWSGIACGDQVWVLVSNLGPRDNVSIDLPKIPGLPDRTPTVPRNSHRLFRWRLDG